MSEDATAEDQQAPVLGYAHQSPANRDLVNATKAMEERVLRFLDDLATCPGVDGRWFAIGRTHIEQGFMAIVRGAANPKRIRLPEDEHQAK